MENLIIRQEEPRDYAAVEMLTREAFWNVNTPGCDEHYLVHVMRGHPDVIEELDLVAELDGKLVGSVLYTRTKLVDEAGNEKPVLTFGPLSVLPEYQRRGIGKRLLAVSFEKAAAMGYDTIVIFGSPANYATSGFKSSQKYNICIGTDTFPMSLLVKELKPGVLDGRRWSFVESPAMEMDPEEAECFDRNFPPRQKGWQSTQEEFYIYSHARLKG